MNPTPRRWFIAALVLGPSEERRAEVLELDVRRRLHRTLQKYPGLHLRELARATGLEPNHAKYHLQYMERHGLVSSQQEEGYWRFWPLETKGSKTVDRRDKRILALLRREVPLHVTLVLLDRGEASLGDLGEAVGVSLSTLHYHLGKMADADLVDSRRDGRRRLFRVVDAERVRSLLVRYQPPDRLVSGFLDAWESLF